MRITRPIGGRLLRILMTTTIIFVSGALVACRDEPGTCDTRALGGLAIAVGGRANSPRPAVPSLIEAEIQQVIDKGTAVTVLQVDGRPEIVCTVQYSSNSVNPAAIERDKQQFVATAKALVSAVRADEAEADVLAALSLAAATAGDGGTVVLIDSGIQTTDPLDMRDGSVLAEDPQRVADELARLGQLPDLRGRTVILASIGYTASPQDRLDEYTRLRLTQLWSAIVARAAGGIAPIIVDGPNTQEAWPDMPPVATVPVIVPKPDFCDTTQVLQDGGPVSFVPDEATFIDPAAARRVLSVYANWLISYPTARATVTGYIAHYGPNVPDEGLALQRAQAVTNELVALGVSPNQLETRGGGWGGVPSLDAGPDPRYDQQNRRVEIAIACG